MPISEVKAGLLESAKLLDIQQAKAGAAGDALEQVQAPYGDAHQATVDIEEHCVKMEAGIAELKQQLGVLVEMLDKGVAGGRAADDVADRLWAIMPTSDSLDRALAPARTALDPITNNADNRSVSEGLVSEFLDRTEGLHQAYSARNHLHALATHGRQYLEKFSAAKNLTGCGHDNLEELGNVIDEIRTTAATAEDSKGGGESYYGEYDVPTLPATTLEATTELGSAIGTTAASFRELAGQVGS